MSRFVTGANAVRLVALFVATVLALTWVHAVTTSPGPGVRRRADVVPAAQPLLPGVVLVPAATPQPAPVPVVVPRHRAGHGQAKNRRRVMRQARTHRAPRSRWRSSGGRDIGWPQCPRNVGFGGRNGLGQPMPDPGVRFVVVGLTDGEAFTPNPCLDRHLRWVRAQHVDAAAYAFATYPTHGQLHRYREAGPYDGRRFLGALGNVGHAAAGYNIALMQRHGFLTPHVWLDVEPSSTRPWSGRPAWNRAVFRGWVRGYRDAGYTVGVYSTRRIWREILGRGFHPRLPEWRTAGPASPRAALRACGGASIQGGPAVLAQWWTTHRDFDRLCPAPARRTTLSRYFHPW